MTDPVPAKISRGARRRRNRIIKTWAVTGGYCVYCNRFTPYALRSVDHLLPRSQGGKYETANLVPACKDCNNARGDKTPAAAYAHPRWRAVVAAKESPPLPVDRCPLTADRCPF
jgi:5-methylcytosine-specific restriction endonuclease McrA